MITYYAIREKETGNYFSGSDMGDYSPIFASGYSTPKLFSGLDLKTQIVRRKIDLDRFEIVPVYLGGKCIVSGLPYAGFPPELEEV